MHRTASPSSAASAASASSYPTIPSSYFGDANQSYSNDTATTFSSSDIRHNNRIQRELHQAIRDSIVAERILDRQARKKYPLTQEEKEEQRLAKRQWELSNVTLKRIAEEQEALLQLVAKKRIIEMSEKKRMEMHPRMQQALAETIAPSSTNGLVQQVFTENTPDISDFIKQQEDAFKTVRRKLRHQQPPAEAWEWERQQQPSSQRSRQPPRPRDRVGAYAAAASTVKKVEPTEADLAAFVRLQEREYRAIQRRIYENRQRERQLQSSPAVSYPNVSPMMMTNSPGSYNTLSSMEANRGRLGNESYVERQNRELQKLANMKLGPSPKNIPAAASKPFSPNSTDMAVASLFQNGDGVSVNGSEASLDDFIQEQRIALESFGNNKQQSSFARLKKEAPPPSISPTSLSRLKVPELPSESSRLKQAPLETTRIQQKSHGTLKQPPSSSVSSLQPVPPNRREFSSVQLDPVGHSSRSSSVVAAPLQPPRPVRRQSSSSSTKPQPMNSDDEVSLPPPPRKISKHKRNPFNGSVSNRSSLTERLKKPAGPLPMTFQKRPTLSKKGSPPPRLVYDQAARSSIHHPRYEQPTQPGQQESTIPNNIITTKDPSPSVYSYNVYNDDSPFSKSTPSAPHLQNSKGNILQSPNYSVDQKSLPSAMTDIDSMVIPEIAEPTVYNGSEDDDEEECIEEEVIEYEEEEYVEEEVEGEEDVNMNIVRSSLGMNDQSCCLRHPNQLICEYSPTFRFDLVNTCKVCASEKQAGASQSTSSLGASQEMAKVIGDIQQLQSDKSQWRQKTNLLYHGDEFYRSSSKSHIGDKDKSKPVVPLLERDWKDQVFRRVDQVQSWEKVTALKYNPQSARFFRMLKMGVPLGAVQIECEVEGSDPAILKFDPERTLKEQLDEHYPNDPDTQANLLLKFDQGSLLEDCSTAEVVTVITEAFEAAYSKKQEMTARKKRKREPKAPPPPVLTQESDATQHGSLDENIRRLEQEKASALSKADDASKRRRVEEEARLKAEEELRLVREAEKEARVQVEENAEEIIILTQAQMLLREKAEDASRRRRAEMDARLQVEEQLQLIKGDESRRLQEQEAIIKEVQRLRKAEVKARLKAQDSSVRRRTEMEARLKAEEQLRKLREMGTSNEGVQQVSQELERLREAEKVARKKAEDSSIRRRTEVDARLMAEEELRRMEDLDSKRKMSLEENEREIKRLKEAEKNARKKAEDSSIRRRMEVEARIKAEDELKKLAALESESQKELGALAAELQLLQKAESDAREKAVEAIRSRREETDARKKLEEELELMKKTEASIREEAEKNAKKLKKEKSAVKDLKKKHNRRLQELDTAKKEAETRAQRLEEEKVLLESKLKVEASERSASIGARDNEANRRHEAEEAIQMMITEQAKHLQEESQARIEAEERAKSLEQEREAVEKRLAFQEGARRAVETEVAQLKAREQDRIQSVKRAQKKLDTLQKEKAEVARKLKMEVQARQLAEEETAKLKALDAARDSESQQREEQAVKEAQHQYELQILRLQDELKQEEQARLEADIARQDAEEEVRQKGIQELKSKSNATKALQREKEAREKIETEAKRLKKEAKRAREMITVSEAAEEEVRQRLSEEMKAKMEAETRLKEEVELRAKAESEAEILKARVAEESAARLKAIGESKRRDLEKSKREEETTKRQSPYPDAIPTLSAHYSDGSWEEMEILESPSETTEEDIQQLTEDEFIEEEYVITSDTSEIEILEKIVDDEVDGMQASLGAQEGPVEGDRSGPPSLDNKPLSDARHRQQLIDTEFERLIQEANQNELEEEIEEEAVEALRIASNVLAYRKKYYNSSEDKFVFYPSIRRLLGQYTLIEKAEQYFYDEEDEFPIEYSAALRQIAFEATGDDSENEEMEQFGVDIVFQDAASSEKVTLSEEAEFEIVANLSDVSNDEDMEEVEGEATPLSAPKQQQKLEADSTPTPAVAKNQQQKQEPDPKHEEQSKQLRPSPVFKKYKPWRSPFE